MRNFFIPVIIAAVMLCGCSSVRDADADIEGVTLPVLMYHSVLKDASRTGEYVITPEQLESDIAYLKNHGYTAVTPEQVTAYVRRGEKLPAKPVMLTFDDGHLNNMTYAFPLMEKYDMTGVINTVGAFTVQAEKENDPNPFYAYLTRENCLELISGGHFDIGCHTYNMHSIGSRKGASKKQGESAEEYAAVLDDDLRKWSELMGEYDIGARVFAYPYGFISEEGYDVLKDNGYDIVLTCRERMNTLYPQTGDTLIILDRFNRSGMLSTEEMMGAVGI